MKNRKEEITELLEKYDAAAVIKPYKLLGASLSHDKLLTSIEVLLEEAFAEGYSFAKEEARLVSEAVKVLGK